DLETGKPTGPPANRPVPVYPTKTEGGRVLVAVEVALAANTEDQES
ncbi:MAG: hypothetical protein QOJ92_503, partial [Frankiales bacterium]|nr:hypothetical protein [Frankiales bacterium]